MPEGRIGVLVSGNGSNLQALLDACAANELDAEVVVVISSRSDAFALRRAREFGVLSIGLPLGRIATRADRARYESEILSLLLPCRLDLLVLAGWMLVLSADFLQRVGCPVINVHPALLPEDGADVVSIPAPVPVEIADSDVERGLIGQADSERVALPALRGVRAVDRALALGLPCTGVTIHHVTADVDAGPLIMREIVVIQPDDTEETLYGRIKSVEHRLLVQAANIVLTSSRIGVAHA